MKRKAVASARSMTTSLLDFKDLISKEVPQNRRQEIYEYMSLFGYKPDSTIIQVHITGFLKEKLLSKGANILTIRKTSRMIRFRLEVLATQQQGVEMCITNTLRSATRSVY